MLKKKASCVSFTATEQHYAASHLQLSIFLHLTMNPEQSYYACWRRYAGVQYKDTHVACERVHACSSSPSEFHE